MICLPSKKKTLKETFYSLVFLVEKKSTNKLFKRIAVDAGDGKKRALNWIIFFLPKLEIESRRDWYILATSLRKLSTYKRCVNASLIIIALLCGRNFRSKFIKLKLASSRVSLKSILNLARVGDCCKLSCSEFLMDLSVNLKKSLFDFESPRLAQSPSVRRLH